MSKYQRFIRDIPLNCQIEVTNRCNLNCGMCNREKLFTKEELTKDMDLQRFKEIIERIPEIPWINLGGRGEPLLHPDIFLMIDFCKTHKKRGYITTNGFLLNKDMIKRLVDSGIDRVEVSLEYIKSHNNPNAHPFDKRVIEYIIYLAKIRKNGLPHLRLQVTLHKDNMVHIFQIIDFARENNITSINIQRLNLISSNNLKRPDVSSEYEFYRKAHLYSKRNRVDLTTNLSLYGKSLPNRFTQSEIDFIISNNLCVELFDNIYVNMLGDVTPCCLLPKYSVGNLYNEDMDSI
ncbi:MAG: radical SAM protein [bacterium]|nr:radical SAM protein [bacterium]